MNCISKTLCYIQLVAMKYLLWRAMNGYYVFVRISRHVDKWNNRTMNFRATLKTLRLHWRLAKFWIYGKFSVSQLSFHRCLLTLFNEGGQLVLFNDSKKIFFCKEYFCLLRTLMVTFPNSINGQFNCQFNMFCF